MSTVNPMLKTFSTMYGEPRTDDVRGFLGMFADALRGFDAKVLKSAADDVVKSRTIPTWPTIAEALEACERASQRMMRAAPAGGRGADHLRRLAEHTMGIIHAMDAAPTKAALTRLHDDWKIHAAQNRIAPQIVQHMADKYRALSALYEIPDGLPDRKSAAAGHDQ